MSKNIDFSACISSIFSLGIAIWLYVRCSPLILYESQQSMVLGLLGMFVVVFRVFLHLIVQVYRTFDWGMAWKLYLLVFLLMIASNHQSNPFPYFNSACMLLESWKNLELSSPIKFILSAGFYAAFACIAFWIFLSLHRLSAGRQKNEESP